MTTKGRTEGERGKMRKRRSVEKGFVILVWWCCAVSMVTGTKACGWPLMANCILHSSFVNCCLPSSYFLLGHGTKPRTGGIRNGTSALQVCCQAPLPLCFSFSSPPFVPPSLSPSFYRLEARALLTLSRLFFFSFPSEYVFTSFVPFSACFILTTLIQRQDFCSAVLSLRSSARFKIHH